MFKEILFVLAYLIFSVSPNRKFEIVNVNVVVRNGIAAPRENLLKISPEAAIGNSSFNSLLPAGKRQMYMLGRQLASNYSRLMADYPKNVSLRIRVLNNLPCRMSAWALALGLAPDNVSIGPTLTKKTQPPFKNQNVVNQFTSPLPGAWRINDVSYSDRGVTDYIFLLSSKDSCPNINTLSIKLVIEEMSRQFPYDQSYQAVASKVGFDESLIKFEKVSKLYLASRLFEAVQALNTVNSDLAISPTSQEYRDLQVSHAAYTFSTVSKEHRLSLLNSPLVNSMIGNMQHSIDLDRNNSEVSKKISIFIGHDKFFLAFLHFLGLYKSHCAFIPYLNKREPQGNCVNYPEAASTVQIEIYKEVFDTDQPYIQDYYVKVLYNGEQVRLGSKEPPFDHQGFIPWEDFKRYMTEHIVKEWEVECGLGSISYQEPSRHNWVLLMVLFNLLLFCFLGGAMYFFLHRPQAAPAPERKGSGTLLQDIGQPLLTN